MSVFVRRLMGALFAGAFLGGWMVVSSQGLSEIKLNFQNTPCDAVARGRAAFNDGKLPGLGGNGRSCADCHVPADGFQLSPAVARARFAAMLALRAVNKNADDPLFRLFLHCRSNRAPTSARRDTIFSYFDYNCVTSQCRSSLH